MIKFILEKITAGENLSYTDAFYLMELILKGELNNSRLAGLLMALRTKGETADEIGGFAKAMREMSIKIKSPSENTIDLCGTGGDGSGSFNVSTAASFAAAGAGFYVAKHGNRSVSSKCGSADVLNELGVNISLPPEKSEVVLHKIGIVFLFAPVHLPSMKNIAFVRNELGVKTIFNMLGPLVNPAQTKRQLIGAFSNKAAQIMAEASRYLNMDKVCFVNSGNKYDEIALNAQTDVYEFIFNNGIRNYSLSSKDFGYCDIDELNIQGGDAKFNAEIILKVLRDKEQGDAFKIISANTAMALYCGGYSDNLLECAKAAEESILSGNAFNKLKLLTDFSNKI